MTFYDDENAHPTEHEMFKIPNTEFAFHSWLKKEGESATLSRKEALENHPGILSAYNSFRLNRSPNTVYFYLLGVTGSGKSSTVNFLFDKEISPTGFGTSITTDTVENISPIKESRLFIDNLCISVVDGPGLEDTGGIRCDARNILCHKQFIETHPQLKNCKPNVVMIAIQSTDNRLGGGNNFDTPFARMLRAVKECLGPKLIDLKHPNIVFVLTNFHMLSKKRIADELPKRITAIKLLSAKFLGVDDPEFIVTENCPEEYDDLVKDENGWYDLRNGEKHPMVLFQKLIDLCVKSKDYIGQEGISKFFSQKKEVSRVIKGHQVSSRDVKPDEKTSKIIEKLRNIKLEVQESDLLILLKKKFEELPVEQKKNMDTHAPYNVTSFLQSKEINSISRLPHDEKFFELIEKFPVHTPEYLNFLQKAFNIKYERRKIDTKVGCCFDIMRDNILGNSIYQFSGKTKVTWAGFEIPEEVDIYVVNTTFTKSEQFTSMEHYIKKRMADLSVSANFYFAGCNMEVRNGYSVPPKSSEDFSDKTILIEQHCFKLTLNEDNLKLNSRFMKEIDELPNSLDKVGEVERWKEFSNKYGTHITKTAWGGGAIVATVKESSKKSDDEGVLDIMTDIEDRLSILSAHSAYNKENMSKNEKFSDTLSIHMEGGDPELHFTNTKYLTDENLSKWRASIKHNPSILTTKLELIPINSIIARHRPEIRNTFSMVNQDLFGANLKYKLLTENVTKEENFSQEKKVYESREAATAATAPQVKDNFFKWLGRKIRNFFFMKK